MTLSINILMIIALIWTLLVTVITFFAVRLRYERKLLLIENKNVLLSSELKNSTSLNSAKLEIYEKAEQRLKDSFNLMTSEALQNQTRNFLQLAESSLSRQNDLVKSDFTLRKQSIESMLDPIKVALEAFDKKVGSLESSRVGAYETLTHLVKDLQGSQTNLVVETTKLTTALRSPVTRGRWGEVQLQRVAELAGMVEYCDFYQQQTATAELGKVYRPDMIIRLPGGKQIVVDAKAPLQSFLQAQDEDRHDDQVKCLKHFSEQVKKHIQQLGQKSYWQQFDQAPEFVVLFLPGENFFSAALQSDPQLIEAGVDHKVILATPTTLIAMLKSVAYGWKQESIEKNAEVVGRLGREIYQRIADLSGHMHDLGRSIKTAVNSYNKTVGTLESRVLVTARKFRDLKADDGKKQIKELSDLDVVPRNFQTEELIGNKPGASVE